MTRDNQELLEILRYELNFLEQGGYRQLAKSRTCPSPFKNSLTCLNYGDPMRPHACHECSLFQFVPENLQVEDVPCHFIPLDEHGRKIADLVKQRRPEQVESALKKWLEKTITRLESEAMAL
jgi:hypothetical protein